MAISEFRFNKRKKHPAYVFKKKKDKYYSLTITHSPKTRNRKNIKLYENPSPEDKRAAYVVKKVAKDNVKSYDKKPLPGWKFHTYDRRNIKRLKKNKKI